ncbi:hypothetical protein E0485_13090 [Paenibacillus albiflavus]|uniref:Uncharacterized protein n=1 Tax=Paenibacillus albiflavus TaxID=2545760 RepID=A0A4R4EBM6_9BACL|nr:hypothetical protein [Paenibacillus albiflavus]TCZ76533.1 hypothetical protein E0485_13090 [Paenibacillus albiflavus]
MKHKVIYSILLLLLLCSGIFHYLQYTDAKAVDKDTTAPSEAAYKDREIGMRNMILQYVDETGAILDEVKPALPILNYTTNGEKEILSQVDTKLLKDNQILLSLKPLGKGEENSFIIEAMIYEKPNKQYISDINNEWPRQIGKNYIVYGQFIMNQKDGKWVVSKFIDKF